MFTRTLCMQLMQGRTYTVHQALVFSNVVFDMINLTLRQHLVDLDTVQNVKCQLYYED